MNRNLFMFFALALLLVGCAFKLNPYSLDTSEIALPFEGSEDTGITEIAFDPRMERVIVPGGSEGGLALVDPNSGQSRFIGGFEEGAAPVITSTTVARGYIYAVDRVGKKIFIVDPNAGTQVGIFPVQYTPEIIRFVPTNNELWVTQPEASQIEVFHVTDGTPPVVEHSGVIRVEGGPQGLIIDRSNGVAYTNQPALGTTAEIQIFTRSILNTWANGCTDGRDLSIDEERRYLFVACGEGKLVVMDLNEKGAQLGSVNYGGQLNGVAYNSTLRHIYLPSGASGVVAVFAVKPASEVTDASASENAETLDPDIAAATATAAAAVPVTGVGADPERKVVLERIATADTVLRANCITHDNNSSLWVCDPEGGRLFRIEDTFPAN